MSKKIKMLVGITPENLNFLADYQRLTGEKATKLVNRLIKQERVLLSEQTAEADGDDEPYENQEEEEDEQECTCVNCVFDGIRFGEMPCVSCVHGCLDEDAPNHFEKKWW